MRDGFGKNSPGFCDGLYEIAAPPYSRVQVFGRSSCSGRYALDMLAKKSAGVVADIDENIVREIGLSAGLVDVKVCAVTDIWSGLKFVRRVKDRTNR